jgi:hypothetical protein
MVKWACISVVIAFALVSCGSASDPYGPDIPTNSPPFVSRIDPNTGSAGNTITIFGFGFSVAVPENIVIMGGAATSATTYTLLSNITGDEIESITAVIPDDAQTGEGPIYVQVHENVSNADVSLTVTP